MMWIVLLALAGGGVWLCWRLQRLEEEIRAEIDVGKEGRRVKTTAAQEQHLRPSATAPGETPEETLGEKVLAVIRKEPGLAQTDIYPQFADESREQLQKVLRDMARDGLIRRERKGSSFRLYPA